jgi:AcrR family transcriptional regulator
MTDQKRPYRKKRRAELEADTRRRITESAMELHGTLGPSRTSMSAVAERAGVRHFPDEQALFAACSSHWAASNPLPDLEAWAAIEDPDERLRTALEEQYAFYRRTRRMLENLFRDEATVAPVKKTFTRFRGYMAAARATVLRGRGNAPKRVEAAIGHALSFSTWRSLTVEQGLDDSQAAALMCRLVAAAARST